ncbi:UNVERIFIED_CONTAM: DEAD-box ATP-dependent RNA helicase FANCM [Sesamum calycinum]|uniref:DEAD-box ATP-dependent RNA helicase FANCM n=1 Tax=Sesamum calycinum TaxID=2727403 RepID=A0AAW2P8W6_9LAMI
MASSSTSLHVIDDDDEFDWEAAAQEIDVACQATAAEKPTSISNISSNLKCNLEYPPQEMRKKGKIDVNFNSLSSTRQSTLDRFIGVSSSNSGKFMGKVEFSKPVDGNNGNNNIIDDKDDGSGAEFEDVEMLNGFVKIDTGAAKTWIYPVNVPRRDYQFSITRTALFSNTLVVLPTGLGKTLIAAAVMYNFFRWFPEENSVSLICSCCNPPLNKNAFGVICMRAALAYDWLVIFTNHKKILAVLFSWNFLNGIYVLGSCLVKHLVCLVIDEAHRAMGNYFLLWQSVRNSVRLLWGDEAVEINNLLLEVVRPFVGRLCAFGVLQKRDFQTLSPCDLLNSRDKFRQEPPMGLHHTKYGEIEGYFGVLITLYHVRKLLSSHGNRPAFEMLDEKLKQGSFARLMSRNEVLLKAKLLMQQTSSHYSAPLSQILQNLLRQYLIPHNIRTLHISC